MILRVQSHPLREKKPRLVGVGVIVLGAAVLTVWNPLTQPGPTVCGLRRAVGLPCPTCGMTRGMSLCLRGQFHEATRFNPLAGPILVLGTLLALKWAIEIVTRRRFEFILTPRLARAMILSVILLALMNWVYLLTYRREDPFTASLLGQLWTMIANAA